MRIFVTGATGLVGSNLVEYLLHQKIIPLSTPQDIVCLVRNPTKATFLSSLGVHMIEGDLSDPSLLNAILEEYDVHYVFHLAALVSVYASFEDMHRTNVIGTRNLLSAFSTSHAQSFIYTSSIIVYDHSQLKKPHYLYRISESSPLGTTDPQMDIPYAVTKRLAEQAVNEYAAKFPEKSFLITRLGPIIGARDRQMIPSLAHALALPLPKLIAGGSGQISLTSPTDVARAQVFLVRNGKNYSGQAFNIAKELWNFKELFEVVSNYYECNPPRVSIPMWVYRIFKPILKLIRRWFKSSEFIQTLLSDSALEYLEYCYDYTSEKLEAVGFSYDIPIRDSIIEGLKDFDPDKELIKPSKRKKKGT